MRVHRTSVFVALLHSCAFSIALPVTDSTITPRSTFCDNAPKIIAGTVLDLRSLTTASGSSVFDTAMSRRTDAMLWCVANSKTYVVLKLGHLIAGESVPATINLAHNVIMARIRQLGDGPVDNGRYSMVGLGGIAVMAWNADNHQLSWGVLGAALMGVLDYMRIFGNGAVTFNIFDGAHMVGQGTVQVPG